MADLELGVRLAPEMVFQIGSITKQFTAAAIFLLAEEGKLSIDDPITTHLPDYPAYGDVGVYALMPAMDLVVTLEDGQLGIQPSGQANLRIFPTSPTELEVEGVEAQLVFDDPVAGHGPAATLHQGGKVLRAPRKE